MVEHVATSEKKDSNQADSSPYIAILYNRHEIWPCHVQEGDRSQDGCGDCNASQPIDRSTDSWMWSIGKMAREPSMYLLSGLGTENLSIEESSSGIHEEHTHC